LGVIYSAYAKGKNPKVYACETRPILQGARLTCWELKKKGITPTLICDSMAGVLLSQGKIDKVIVGADRIASNGDTANKIGTLTLAILSKHFGVNFYVAAPKTTFDLSIPSGKFIKIEQRSPQEITHLYFKKPIAPKGINVFNPAFDLTPNELITAFITDYGIIRPPFKKNIRRILKC
ncbi:MAG: S-methyl-5-thioribose-1-phosphate isomerase, partial [Candidatus Omnitrophica bacterium]|nr:S-methyl-5-thioribose-1-phosphate isomerase [Candidatus Omnitrophota bacterium]